MLSDEHFYIGLELRYSAKLFATGCDQSSAAFFDTLLILKDF